MIRFPKIDGLYVRSKEDPSVLTSEHRHPVYRLINEWWLEEKLDGTNCRLVYIFEPDHIHVEARGRSDSAALHPELAAAILERAPRPEAVIEHVIGDREGVEWVVFYGEGIGPKVQGNPYQLTSHEFRVFDIKVPGKFPHTGWFRPNNVHTICGSLGLDTVPVLARASSLAFAEGLVRAGQKCDRWPKLDAEGIVAKSPVPLYDARGARIQVKFKARDLRR